MDISSGVVIMNIQNAQYVVDDDTNENIAIVGTVGSTTVSVPIDTANTDYNEIMKQVAAGDLTIADAD